MAPSPTHTGTTKSLARRTNRKKRRQRLTKPGQSDSDSSLVSSKTLSEDTLNIQGNNSAEMSPVRSTSDDIHEKTDEVDAIVEAVDLSFDCVGDDRDEPLDCGSNDVNVDSDLKEVAQIEPVEEARERKEYNDNAARVSDVDVRVSDSGQITNAEFLNSSEQEFDENSPTQKPIHLEVGMSQTHRRENDPINEDLPNEPSTDVKENNTKDSALLSPPPANNQNGDNYNTEHSSHQISSPLQSLGTNPPHFYSELQLSGAEVDVNNNLSIDSESDDEDHYFQQLGEPASTVGAIKPPPSSSPPPRAKIVGHGDKYDSQQPVSVKPTVTDEEETEEIKDGDDHLQQQGEPASPIGSMKPPLSPSRAKIVGHGDKTNSQQPVSVKPTVTDEEKTEEIKGGDDHLQQQDKSALTVGTIIPPPPPSPRAKIVGHGDQNDGQQPISVKPTVTNEEKTEEIKGGNDHSQQLGEPASTVGAIIPPPPPPSSPPPRAKIVGHGDKNGSQQPVSVKPTVTDEEETEEIKGGGDHFQQQGEPASPIGSMKPPLSPSSSPPPSAKIVGRGETSNIQQQRITVEPIGTDEEEIEGVKDEDHQPQNEQSAKESEENDLETYFVSEASEDTFNFRQINDTSIPLLQMQSAILSQQSRHKVCKNDSSKLEHVENVTEIPFSINDIDTTTANSDAASIISTSLKVSKLENGVNECEAGSGSADALASSQAGNSAPCIDLTSHRNRNDVGVECPIVVDEKMKVVEMNSKSYPDFIPHSPRISRVKLPPVSPMSPKMAEKIALASSRADKKFNDLMTSREESRSRSNSNDLSCDGMESPSLTEDKELIRGAFTPLSNSTKACISPMGGSTGESPIDQNECTTSTLDHDLTGFSRRLDSELIGVVEVELSPRPQSFMRSTSSLLKWLNFVLLDQSTDSVEECNDPTRDHSLKIMKSLLNQPGNINKLCRYVADSVNAVEAKKSSLNDQNGAVEVKSTIEDAAMALLRKSDELQPFQIPLQEFAARKTVLSINFAAFVRKIVFLTGIDSPKGYQGLDVESSFREESNEEEETLQGKVFGNDDDFAALLMFLREVTDPEDPNELLSKHSEPEHEIIYELSCSGDAGLNSFEDDCLTPRPPTTDIKKIECLTDKRDNRSSDFLDFDTLKIPPPNFSLYYNVPAVSPCPFEISVWNVPSIVLIVLGCLGDPVAVCRMKMVNKFCNRIINENEYVIMKDSVRLGGISMHIRPAFWMWLTLERCQKLEKETKGGNYDEENCPFDFKELEQEGRESKWHHIIERDVIRAFGNFPPHKANGSRRNSIVRALVTWGQNHLLRRHTDGTCRVVPTTCPSEKPIRRLTMSPPPQRSRNGIPDSPLALKHSETVSDWGGISPVGSNISSAGSLTRTNSLDLVLSGNELTLEVKADLQKKLGSILDVIAAVHEGFGYCQGESQKLRLSLHDF
jgi:hypothetical protein